MNIFDTNYKKGKTHLKNARKQESDGHLKEALDAYQKAIEEFKAHGSSLFHDVERHLAEAYVECGDIYKCLGEMDNANTYYKEAQKYEPKYSEALVKSEISSKPVHTENIPIESSFTNPSASLIETTTPTCLSKLEFFVQDPLVTFEPHSKIDNINSTQDLAYYLQPNNHTKEQAPQLIKLAQDIVQLFADKKLKTQKTIHEVVILASIPNEEIYKDLLEISINEIKNSTLQHSKHLFCLTQVIQNMPDLIVGKVGTGNLLVILEILHAHLEKLHKQDNEAELSELLQTLCPLLDAMVRIGVRGINREKLHAPLYKQLNDLKDNTTLAYHAHYACQALLYIPSDEKLWQELMRRAFKISSGTINLVNAVRSLDPNKLLDTFKDFSEAFENFNEIASCIRELVEVVQTLRESVEDIRQGIEFEQTRQWYLALRFIDIFIQENQLKKLEQFVRQFVRQSPYNKNKWFFIGLCQRLGQIACTQRDLKIQKGAVEFLNDLCQNEIQWGQHPEVIDYAKAMIDKVASGENALNSSIYGNSELIIEARLKSSQNLESYVSEPLAQLGKIRKEFFDELEQDEEIKNALGLYVTPKGKWSLNATNSFDLKAEVDAFLTSEKNVLLLLGEAGAGKSTFNRHLAQCLWRDYSLKDELDNKPIPLFISLPAIDNPNEKIIQKYLKELRFSEEIIENLRQNCKFVLILDGYDEIKDRRSNFYDKNKLREWKEAKIIISCRPEYLNANYKSKFLARGNSNSFQEIWLAPFSREQIREYTRKHVIKQKGNTWNAQKYEAILDRIPDSDQLLSNPFILKIAIQVVPDLENENSAKNMTRLILYNKFIEKWFERSKDRLEHVQLKEEEKKAFEILDEGDFLKHCVEFNKDLAAEMFKANEIVVMYSDVDNTKTHTGWHAKFFGYEDPKIRLLRYNSPLSRNGAQYRFIHKSLFEYFLARSIFEDICKKTRSTIFEEISILDDPGVVRFLTEYARNDGGLKDAQQDEKFNDILLKLIEKSKEDTNFEIAAANAITILNKAGMSFSGKNLNNIHIAGADLSYGLFHCTQFKQADLNNVNFKGTWLQYADFSEANMIGVQFGEFPFLYLEGWCYCCCYSPDGRSLAAASGKNIFLYNVETLEKIHTLEGHTDYVNSVTFSPDGTQLASGSSDKTVRLWYIDNLDLNPRILEGHTNRVFSVTFSPDGKQLASGSDDYKVRLWYINNFDLNSRILEGHTNGVLSVAFSPDGTQLASGSSDKTVRLWSIENLDTNPRILEGHTDLIRSVTFSPDGTQLASGSSDKTVRLWSIENLDLNPRILEGHTNCVFCVTFSPDGTQLASSSSDKTVRLWSIENLYLNPRILEGHTDWVYCVTFSPDGTQLASGSDDYKVRLWYINNFDLNSHILEGHTNGVLSVTISPDGTQLASSSSDKTVRLWSIENLHLNPRILEGHSDNVRSVTFSPDSTQLASGSEDNTVRLWSIKNLDLNPRILEGHLGTVWSVTFSPDGTQLASGSSDKTVRLWSIENLDLNIRIIEHSDTIGGVIFSPDGTQLASHSDKTVWLWSIENLNPSSRILEGHSNTIRSVTFSPDGTQLASGSYRTVRLWSIENLDLNPRILEGHNGTVWSVAFSPDGIQLASSSSDNTVRLWSVISGNCVAIIYLPGEVYSLDWKNTKAGDLLLTGGADKIIRLWHVKRIDDKMSQASLYWTSCQNMLWISKAYIQNVKGLDLMNLRLLKQRGATEDSEI